MKKATTVEEQIDILITRGMLLDLGHEKTKEILLDIGYFRLGFYCFPFEKTYPDTTNRSHEYKEGSYISDVVKLYYLDVDLRHLLIKYINRIEVHFRTSLIYWVSNEYNDSNTWFVDPAIVQKDFIPKVEVIYDDIRRKKNQIINDHHKKYINDRYAPVWKTLEYFTFGSILKTFQNLRSEKMKNKICALYGINSIKTLENYMQAIIDVRNACAHGSVLFDFSSYKGLKKGPAACVDSQNRHNLYSIICVINYMLSKVSFNRATEMNAKISILFNAFESNQKIKSIIKNRIGYPYE